MRFRSGLSRGRQSAEMRPTWPKAKKKSLYERLGGHDAIAALVDDLLARLFGDKKVNGFRRGHSEHSRCKERQVIVEFLCEAAGGPVCYLGCDMRTAHTGLRISD